MASRLKKSGAATAGLAALAVTTIGAYEGLRLSAYKDVIGVATICYGETKGVRMGMRMSKAECDAKFLDRLDEFGGTIEKCVPMLKTASKELYVSQLSLSYNIGTGGYCKSSVARLLNAGQTRAACDFMLKYNRAGGVVWSGLTKRRQQERSMCLKGA